MSTILDALKQVEERIRTEAAQKSTDGLPASAEPSKPRLDASVQLKNAAPGETDEVMKVYSGLVDMLNRIQNSFHTVMNEGRAEARSANAELAQTVAALKSDSIRLREAVQKEFQRRDAERDAENAAMAALQSQTDSLKRLFAETGETSAASAQAMAAQKNDSLRLKEAVQAAFHRWDAEREAGNTALAALQSQTDSLKRLFNEAGAANTALAQDVAALQADFLRQAEALRNGLQKQETERAAVNAVLAEARSQADALKALLAVTKGTHAELAQAMAALQHDSARQREEAQKEIQKRDAAMAETQSQVGTLQKLLAEAQRTHAELAQTVMTLRNDVARHGEAGQTEPGKQDAERGAEDTAPTPIPFQDNATEALSVMGADAGAPVPGESSRAAGKKGKPGTRISKDDALKLHADARKAYTKGEFAGALDLLDIIDAAFPGNASVLYNRAQCLIGLGRNDEARGLCDYLVTTLNHAPARELKSQIRH